MTEHLKTFGGKAVTLAAAASVTSKLVSRITTHRFMLQGRLNVNFKRLNDLENDMDEALRSVEYLIEKVREVNDLLNTCEKSCEEMTGESYR